MNASPSLETRLGPLTLKNPILVSAGTFGYGLEFSEFFDLSRLGGIITKTLTLQPRIGNPAPRVVETPSGMLNAVGLQNIGIDAFMAEKWPALKKLQVPIVVSIAGFSEAEFSTLAERLQGCDCSAIELNLSCPNVSHGDGGRCFAQSPEMTAAVLKNVKTRLGQRVIFAKLSPEVTDLKPIAEAAMNSGADALSLINTMPGMVVDVEAERPVLAHGTGGLSGPAIRPLAVRCVYEVYQHLKAPILGMGGIASGRDALEFLLAGASAVSLGTANFWNPKAALLALNELTSLLEKKGKSVEQVIGKLKRPV